MLFMLAEHETTRTVLAIASLGVAIATAMMGASALGSEKCAFLMVFLIFLFAPVIDGLTSQVKVIGNMPVGSTYTCWNCLLCGYMLIDYVVLDRPPLLLPYLVGNSWAIWGAFNVVGLLDSTFFVRAATWTGYPLGVFQMWNAIFHLVPAVACTLWFFVAQPTEACCTSSAGSTWLITSLFHALWVVRTERTIFLNKRYFECPRWQWYVAWNTALAMHLFIGWQTSLQCQLAISQCPIRA